MTLGAEVAAAPGDDDAFDRLAASPAGLACPLVNTQLGKEISGPAFNVNIIAEASPLKCNGAFQHAFYFAQQAVSVARGNPARLSQRVQPREVERFVGINISDPGKHLLVHQPAFQRAAPAAQRFLKLFVVYFPGIRTEAAKNRVKLMACYATQAPKSARVYVTKFFPAVFERQSNVSMRCHRLRARVHRKLTCHSQPHQKVSLPGVSLRNFRPEFERNGLALAPGAQDLSSADLADKLVWRSCDDLRMAYLGSTQPAPDHALLEAAQNCFDFGKFRHIKSGKGLVALRLIAQGGERSRTASGKLKKAGLEI